MRAVSFGSHLNLLQALTLKVEIKKMESLLTTIKAKSLRVTTLSPSMSLILLTLLSIVVLTGCYSFSQTSLPRHIQSITIYPAANKTYQALMGDRLTQGIQELFLKESPNLRQINSGAHAEFYSTLVSYTNAPMNFNSSGQVNLYQVRLKVDVRFVDQVKAYDIYEKKGLTSVGVYDVSKGESEELHGQKRALDELQSLIISNALSGW